MNRTQDGIIEKGWGSEIIFASNDLYCGKLLNFKEGSKSSMHYHKIKDETFHVLSGVFVLHTIDTADASLKITNLNPGDTIRLEPDTLHQIHCYEAGVIVEVSTPDYEFDNYRVFPGDSQK